MPPSLPPFPALGLFSYRLRVGSTPSKQKQGHAFFRSLAPVNRSPRHPVPPVSHVHPPTAGAGTDPTRSATFASKNNVIQALRESVVVHVQNSCRIRAELSYISAAWCGRDERRGCPSCSARCSTDSMDLSSCSACRSKRAVLLADAPRKMESVNRGCRIGGCSSPTNKELH